MTYGQLLDELLESLTSHLQISGQEQSLGHGLCGCSFGTSVGHGQSDQAAEGRGDQISILGGNGLKQIN
jgi:hypothetical protein